MNKVEINLNWYDRLVGFFNPRALLKRKRAKIYNEILARKYEGADSGRRTSGWNTSGGSANAEIAGSKFKLRERSRDLIRNNPYASRAVHVITNNVVGPGIKVEIKHDTRASTSTKEKRSNQIWKAWAETTACDYDGRNTLSGLQAMVMRAVVESGDVLVRRRRTNRKFAFDDSGKRIELPPIELQVLEGDFLALNQVSRVLDNGNTIIEGVELDPTGKTVAYHVYKTHPGNINLNIQNTFDTIRIPIEEILLVFKSERPGQLSGVPWLHAVMLRLRDFDLYEDAQLKRQQCAAMFTAFIHDMEAFADEDEENEQEEEIGEKMEPGLMEFLPPGKDIKLSNPPGADNYDEYTSVVLRSIASGMNITYFDLTGDLSDINFSAGRLGWLEFQRNVSSWQKGIMISQFLFPVFSWFVEGMELIGNNMSDARMVATPPKREMIDPTKEVEALKTAVRSGFKSLSEAARELGNDPDNHFDEISKDFNRLDELGLTLDIDSRKRDNAGKVNAESELADDPNNTDVND